MSSPLPPLPISDNTISKIKSTITNLFEQYGSEDYIGESISQLEHALQAAHIAEANGEEHEMIIAALLHDIGHLVVYEQENSDSKWGAHYQDDVSPYLGAHHHEKIGADYLRNLGLEENIPELVESHISSKRWLSRDPIYHAKLSEASKQTLIHQGGPMTDEESIEYLKHPKHIMFTSLRLYDDGAKVVGKKTKDLEYYLSYLDRLTDP
jgi:2-amino-1-hydroxyethylphosphonate dioxygenase (glycine-forming)